MLSGFFAFDCPAIVPSNCCSEGDELLNQVDVDVITFETKVQPPMYNQVVIDVEGFQLLPNCRPGR
jgi:hypothetical protein